MNGIERLALSKVVQEKSRRALSRSLKPGSYTFDFYVRIHGAMRKQEDYIRKSESSNAWKTVALHALRKLKQKDWDIILEEVMRKKTVPASFVDCVIETFDIKKEIPQNGAVVAAVECTQIDESCVIENRKKKKKNVKAPVGEVEERVYSGMLALEFDTEDE